MNEKLMEILNAINDCKARITALVDEGKIEEAKALKEGELKDLSDKFDLLKDVVEDGAQQALAVPTTGPVAAVPVPGTEDAVHEFAQAARRGFVVDLMQEGGSTGEDGGYTVPEDIQTKINHYKNAQFSLRQLVRVETVKTNKGARTYQTKAQATGFAKVDENGIVQETAGPKYTRIPYVIEDYAGYLPVTNDLLNDSDANIADEIVKWIGENSLATDNNEILAVLQGKTAVEFADLNAIKRAINVTLGQAYRAGVRIVTNDDGLNYLDTLEDLNHRPLLNPNPTEPNKVQLRVGATVVPVDVVPNAILATTNNNVPFIVGDLKEAATIFDRQKTTIISSDVAAVTGYNAFAQRGRLFRADVRADYVAVDSDAWVNGYITVTETEGE